MPQGYSSELSPPSAGVQRSLQAAAAKGRLVQVEIQVGAREIALRFFSSKRNPVPTDDIALTMSQFISTFFPQTPLEWKDYFFRLYFQISVMKDMLASLGPKIEVATQEVSSMMAQIEQVMTRLFLGLAPKLIWRQKLRLAPGRLLSRDAVDKSNLTCVRACVCEER